MAQPNNLETNSESSVPMRWAAKRIASAAILVLLILGGLSYGIYSLVNTGSSPTVSKPQSSSKVKAPAPKQTTTSTSPSVASQASTPIPTPTTAQTSGQLTNTGPGDVALVGFISVTLVAALTHYGWGKLKLRRNFQA
jgi:hypothetical protein